MTAIEIIQVQRYEEAELSNRYVVSHERDISDKASRLQSEQLSLHQSVRSSSLSGGPAEIQGGAVHMTVPLFLCWKGA